MPQSTIKKQQPQTLDFLRVAPIRGTIINEDFKGDPDVPKAMEFFFNPDAFDFKTAATWARIPVPGLSHEVLQWSHTKSNEMSFRLQWNWTIAIQREKGVFNERFPMLTDKKMEDIRGTSHDKAVLYRDFLYALTLPVERGRAPSRVTIVWPGVIHSRGVITKADFRFTRFHHDGGVIAFDANIDFIELRRVFLSRQGTRNYFNRPPEDPPPDQITYVERKRKSPSKPKNKNESEGMEIAGMSRTTEGIEAAASQIMLDERVKRTWNTNEEAAAQSTGASPCSYTSVCVDPNLVSPYRS